MSRNLSLQLGGALQKALQKQNPGMFLRQLFRTQTGIAPLVMDDNPETYIDEGYSFNPDVYAVIQGITSAASSIPFVVHEVVDEKSAREYYQLKKSNRKHVSDRFVEKASKLRKKAFEIADPDSDIVKLMERPNPLQSWEEFIENALGFKEVTGNSYIHGVELSDGRFSEMWIMPPQLTRIIADKSYESIVKSYVLDIYGYNEPIKAETVLHMKYWNPDYTYPGSHLYGMSPLKSARRSVISSNQGLNALAKALENNGVAGMLFPDDPDLQDLTEEQRANLQRWFDQNRRGSDNYKSALVTSAKMGWQPFGLSPIDLEIIEARKMSMRDICNVYGYPSEMLNDPDNKTNANKSESRRQLYQDCVVPRIERFYSALNRFITPRFNAVEGKTYHIDYDLSGIEALQDDIGKKVEYLSKAWWIPPNRKAEEMSFDPIDNPMFDQPFIPMGLIPLSDLSIGELSEEDQKLLRAEYDQRKSD